MLAMQNLSREHARAVAGGGGGGGVHAAGGHILHHDAPYAIAESGLGSVVGE